MINVHEVLETMDWQTQRAQWLFSFHCCLSLIKFGELHDAEIKRLSNIFELADDNRQEAITLIESTYGLKREDHGYKEHQ